MLTGSLDMEDMTAQAGETEKFVQSVGVLSDRVSDAFSVENNCGSMVYEVVDSLGAAAPDYVSLVYTEGDPTFDIEVDVADYTDDSLDLQLYVRAHLSDYPQAFKVSSGFELEILEAVPFVFAPPPVAEVKPQPEPPVIDIQIPLPKPAVAKTLTVEPIVDESADEADKIRSGVNEDQT